MLNAFESGARKVIPAVLVYVRADDRVLMIHRNVSKTDYHLGKWNGLGGKLEADESPLEGARREIREEAGLDLPESSFRVLGVLQFPNFKAHKAEDWLVFVLAADAGCGLEPLAPCPPCKEGELHWVAAADVPALNLWPGDRHFIELVLDGRSFVGTIWYEGERVVRHWIQET